MLPLSQKENALSELPRKRLRFPSYASGATNVTFQQHKIGREERAATLGLRDGFRGCTMWLTGLSGAGKTTVSFALEKALTQIGITCISLDGDNVRHGLCKDLGFSKADRTENIRRVAEMAKTIANIGVVVLASFISPFREDRDSARRIHDADSLPFFEIYVDTSLEVCETRDPKKLYKKARAGEISGMTGIDSAYEQPTSADLVLHSGIESVDESIARALHFLHDKGVIPEKALSSLLVEPEEVVASPAVRELFVPAHRVEEARAEAASLADEVALTTVDLQWMQVLAEGWASPLTGFMRERQYLQSLHFGQLLDTKTRCVYPGDAVSVEGGGAEDTCAIEEGASINQTIPIVLPISGEQKAALLKEDGSLPPAIALSHNGRRVAILHRGEVYEHRKKERVARQFGCTDERHPGVAQVLASGDFCLGGDIEVLERITYGDGLDAWRKMPAELRRIFQEKGADAVFAFQLRNPIHNGHALLMRETRKRLLKKYRNPVLLLHPLGGWTKDDDVPLDVRMRQHEAVIEEGLLGADWTVLSIFPSPMMYAGPTEVQWHARARLAAGIQAYIVGRDPAGVPDPASESGDALYEVTHGAKVLSMAPGLSHLEIVPFRVAAYDKKASQMAIFEPSRAADFEFISGTKMRTLARTGQLPPDGFMAPKAWEILAGYYRNLAVNQ